MHLVRRAASAALLIGLALSAATPWPQAQAAAGGTVSPAGAVGQAAGTEASHWSRAPGVVPPLRGARLSVSCPRLSHCTAVDAFGNASVFEHGTWTGVRNADHHLGPLASVSCPTTRFCAAVGGQREVAEKKGSWGGVHVAPANLTSVSCWAASRCRAVGDDGTTMRYDGSWHRGPDAATADLVAVSCTSRHFCMASTTRGESWAFHAGRWIARGAALPDITCADAPPGSACTDEVVSLDCATSHLCMAATGLTWVSRWDGTTWKRHQLEPGRASVSASVSCAGRAYCAWITHGGDFAVWRHGWEAVSHHRHVGGGDSYPLPFDCSAAARCLVVGGLTTTTIRTRFHRFPVPKPSPTIEPRVDCPRPSTCVSVNRQFSARVFHHGRWTAVPSGHFIPGGPISCASPTFCAIPGATWDGEHWTRAGSWPHADEWSIDCVSATYCLAAGLYDEGDDPNEVWNGTAWSAIPESLESVATACAAVSDCWTLSSAGTARHWDGTSWSSVETLFSTPDGQGLACPAANSCLAWNHTGEVVHLRDGVWGGGEQVAPMSDVDCASSTSCLGMLRDRPGRVATYNGSGWTVERALPKGYGGTVTDVSCGSPRACMVVDQQGNAFRRVP